ncbi:hypothetical protein BCEP4_240002 [Burkholderia cepacia]|nr:hypothetical protein BCEP4_240002 [Burkholderia cepacia]
MVVMIDVAHTMRMRFGKRRNKNRTCHCGSRQDLRDALHETLPGKVNRRSGWYLLNAGRRQAVHRHPAQLTIFDIVARPAPRN